MDSRIALSCCFCCALLATKSSSADSAVNHKAKIPRESRRSETHEIEKLEDQWRTAIMSGDGALMAKLISDDFLGISARGTLSDRQQYLQRIATHATQFSTVDITDFKLRVKPGSAVAVSQARVTGRLEGTPIQGTFRYTKVYTHNASGWKITNFEATRMSTTLAEGQDMNNGIPLDAKPSQAHAR